MSLDRIGICFLLLVLFFHTITRQVSSGTVFFDPSKAAYYDEIKSAFNLTLEQEAMLQEYGFVVVELPATSGEEFRQYGFRPTWRFEDFYFFDVYAKDLPVLITADSILHLFHVVFDCSLRILEDMTFYSKILEITRYAYNRSLSDYHQTPRDGSSKYWATRNATVYFAVALSLAMGENATIPDDLKSDETYFLDNIYATSLAFVDAGRWSVPLPPYGVAVEYDFTQFTVRGHYLGKPVLEKYFRTLMWYGNFPICIPRNDEQYVWFVPHMTETAAVYMRDLLKLQPSYFEYWMTLYNVTSELIGESDSVSPSSLEDALQATFGDSESYLDLVTAGEGIAKLREELSKPQYAQKILGQALVSDSPDALPRYPLVFQFMGQRYVPDSLIFQYLCWDKVQRNSAEDRRVQPKGLDLFAVLNSTRAYELLTPDFDFRDYLRNLESLRDDFSNLTESDWQRSAYMSWIHTLQNLVNIEYGEEYPEFMRTTAWQDEKLNTALGSWAQLRHDTTLYAKQTYIPAFLCSYPEAFVEPNPSFYRSMQQLVERTMDALSILPANETRPIIRNSLETLLNVTERLETISTKELNKQPLTAEETDFIKTVAWGCGSGGYVGWYLDTIHGITNYANYTSILDVPVIADVATFPPGDIEYPPQIRHVAVGSVRALIVLYPKANGNLVAAVGPVFSYYEFSLVGTKRLNDDEWREMLEWENRTEYLPEWVKDIYGTRAPLTEYSVLLMLAAAMITTSAVAMVARVVSSRRKEQHECGRSKDKA